MISQTIIEIDSRQTIIILAESKQSIISACCYPCDFSKYAFTNFNIFQESTFNFQSIWDCAFMSRIFPDWIFSISSTSRRGRNSLIFECCRINENVELHLVAFLVLFWDMYVLFALLQGSNILFNHDFIYPIQLICECLEVNLYGKDKPMDCASNKNYLQLKQQHIPSSCYDYLE